MTGLTTFVLAQMDDGNGGGGAIGMVMGLVYLVIVIAAIAGMWKTFEKAGKPGWASIIPFYNYFVLDEIIGKPAWWIVLWIIPCTLPFVAIIACLELAKCFGKGAGFGLGLAFLGPIFFPLLGFGDAQYRKPVPAAA